MSEEHAQGEAYPHSLEMLKFLMPKELPPAFAPKRKQTDSRDKMLRLLADALDCAHDGIVIFDIAKSNLPICYVNGGFQRLTGYSQKESAAQSFNFLHGPGTCPDAVRKMHEAIRRRRHISVEILQYRKDGNPVWMLVSLTTMQVEEGAGEYCVGIMRDITPKIEARDQLHETMRLLESTNLELSRQYSVMEEHLDHAQRIQRAMLPSVLPETDQVRFKWLYEPSEHLAGDSLNVFWLDENHIGVYLLDVSGHGIAAALLAVSVSKMLQPTTSASSLVWRQGANPREFEVVSPAQVVNELNRHFPWDPEGGQFFTIVYGVLNIETFAFRYVNAGHPSPVYISPYGEVEYQKSPGLPVGISNKPYEEQALQLEPGGRLLIFSDGITDVMNERQELWGQIRLCKALRNSITLDLEECLRDILLRTNYWSGSKKVEDDRTMVGLDILHSDDEMQFSSNFGDI